MLNLSHECRHPDNGQQYVMNSHGGRNKSLGPFSVSFLLLPLSLLSP